MYVTELVDLHGTGIVVSCNKPSYPPFKVIKRLQGKKYLCEYDDGKPFELDDCLNDYEVVKN